MNAERTLQLAILAQAVYDCLLDLELGIEDERAESAWAYLSGHDRILRKLQRLSKEERMAWIEQLQEALES